MADFDVLIYGATGFTGRQCAAYLAASPDGRALRVALAGRNRSKLERVAQELGSDAELVVADSADPASVAAAVRRARVVLSTAGPYALYGDPVVDACATHGVDYVDITGESPWVRRVIDRHHDTASASGTKIVPFCGFDSVPSDLGAWLVTDHFRRQGRQTRRVDARFKIGRGALNGGTLATMLTLGRSGDWRAAQDTFLLSPPSDRTAQNRRAHPDPSAPRYDTTLARWTAPFVMGPINSRVVRRSDALAEQLDGQRYGERFRYEERQVMGRGLRGRAQATLTAAILAGMAQGIRYEAIRRLIARLGPSPGEGPTQAQRDAGYFSCRHLGVAEDASTAQAEIAYQGDPGNKATVLMVCESALCLVHERDALPGGPERGGVLTPATAFGGVLAQRLRSAGMTVTLSEPS